MNFIKSAIGFKINPRTTLIAVLVATIALVSACDEQEEILLDSTIVDENSSIQDDNIGVLTAPSINVFDETSCTGGNGGSITGQVDAGDIAALFDLEGNLIAPQSPSYDANAVTSLDGSFVFSRVPDGDFEIIAFNSSLELYRYILNGEIADQSLPTQVSMLCPEDVNLNPVAAGNIVNVGVGETVLVDVLRNDFDPNGDELTVIDAFGGSPHIVELVGNQIQVTRVDSNIGSFVIYTISDGRGGSDQASLQIPRLTGSN